MVILLHRGADFRPRAIINSRYRPVIVHHMGRGKSDKPPASHGVWRVTVRAGNSNRKGFLVASLLGGGRILALILILVHTLEVLHVETLEVKVRLERLSCKRKSARELIVTRRGGNAP
jgi:hypothetical protein